MISAKIGKSLSVAICNLADFKFQKQVFYGKDTQVGITQDI